MPDTPPLTPLAPADLEQTIHYAMTFDERGKAHGKRLREDRDWISARIVAHMERCGYRVFRGPGTPSHTAGGGGPRRTDGREEDPGQDLTWPAQE